MRTFIIGGTVAEARAFCRENGIRPYAKSTVIATHPDALRGHTITPEDEILWHRDTHPEMSVAVRIAEVAGAR